MTKRDELIGIIDKSTLDKMAKMYSRQPIKNRKELADAILAWHAKEIVPIRTVYKELKDASYMIVTSTERKMWQAIRQVVEKKGGE